MTVITVSIEIKTVFALLVILVVEDAQGLMKGNALNVQMLATHSLMENVREFSINYQNSVGITSSKWPINNSELPLKGVQIHLELENDTNFNFMFGINP